MIITIKWYGTLLCLIGIALTSINIYPLNIVFGFVGSGLWTLAGYLQRDTPLFLVEFVATIMYAFGIVAYLVYALIKWGLL
jgi:hypothetical protein